jgi:transposase InsO family protein
MWAVLLPSKDAAADAIKKVQAEAEKESNHKLRVLHNDNSGEFTVAEFAAYWADEGIKRHFSAPHSSQQNGVVERQNQTVVATARVLLRQRRLLAKYCGGDDDGNPSAQSLVDKKLAGQDPLRGLARAHASSELFEDFRLVAYTKDLGQLRKLDDRGKPGVFIGYVEGAKAY